MSHELSLAQTAERAAISKQPAANNHEPVSRYNTVLGIEKEDISHENTYSWDINSVFSRE
jgi:hypothetical protein